MKLTYTNVNGYLIPNLTYKSGEQMEQLGKYGLVHISQLALERVKQVEDVVKIGDEIMVKCIEIDEKGRVNLSRKVLLNKEEN